MRWLPKVPRCSQVMAYYPSRGRFAARAAACTVVVNAVAVALAYTGGSGYTWQLVLSVLAFFIWMVFWDIAWRRGSWAIRLGESDVSGPRGWLTASSRETIRLDELDIVGTPRRTPMDRLLGRQYLHSADGRRIYLHRWAFARRDLQRLVELLGIGERSAGTTPNRQRVVP